MSHHKHGAHGGGGGHGGGKGGGGHGGHHKPGRGPGGAPKHPKHGKHPKHKRSHHRAHKHHGLAMPTLGETWLLGGNDAHDTCTMTALANHLAYWKGEWAQDEEILDAGTGLSLAEAMEWVGKFGLAGHTVSGAWLEEVAHPGVIAAMTLDDASHMALVLSGESMASWGAEVTLEPADDYWQLTWERRA